jgi:hypothetical protein
MADLSVRVARRGGRLLGIFVGLVLVFVLAMTAVYALPQGRIVENLQASVGTLAAEGQHPQILADSTGYVLCNYTDALMLDTSIVTRPGGPLLTAMADDHGQAGGVQTGGASDLPGRLPMPVDTIAALAASAAGQRGPASAYAYYWHGYQVFLRPALIFFTYTDIRWLNMLGLALLGFVVLIAMDRLVGWKAAAAFFFSLLLVGGFVVPVSLAFSPVFYVMLASVLAVLLLAKGDRFSRVDLEIFLVTGMLTAFFDLLTAPLLTLGMPLVVVFVVLGRDGRVRNLARDARLAVRLSATWAFGYGAAWIAKWFLASAIVHVDVVHSAATEFLFRVGATQGPRPIEGLVTNFVSLVMAVLTQNPTHHDRLFLIAGLVVVVIVVLLLVRFRQPREIVVGALPVLLVVPLPYLWFLLANQHSTDNAYFTYRIQAMALFAILYVVLASIDFGAVLAGVRKPLAGRRSKRDAG